MDPNKIDIDNEIVQFMQIFDKVDKAIQNKKTIPDRITAYGYEFFIKIYCHFITMCTLRNGSNLDDGKIQVKVQDYSAILTINRATLETVLLFYYIYIDSKNNEELEFRYYSWEREGMLTRQHFIPLDADGIEKLKQEKNAIIEIEKKVYNNNCFKILPKDQKAEYKNRGKWRPGWKNIMKIMNVTPYQSSFLYSYLSSYAHCEYLNLLQNSQMTDINERKKMVNIQFWVLFEICSAFLYEFIKKSDITIEKEKYDYTKFWKDIFINDFLKNVV